MTMPMMAGRVRYTICFMPIDAVGGSLLDMYMDERVEAIPISMLLNVTISAGENIGDGILVVVLVMISPRVNCMSRMHDHSMFL